MMTKSVRHQAKSLRSNLKISRKKRRKLQISES